MKIQLKKINQKEVKNAEAVIKILNKDDFKKILELLDYVDKLIPNKELFEKDDPEFVLDTLIKNGKSYGVFYKNKLIAYGSLYFPSKEDSNLGLDIDLPKKELDKVAHLETQIVHPDYRGNDLQTILNKVLIQEAKKNNYKHVMATASPKNIFSVNNLLKLGLKIIKTKKKYGGKERHIMHMEIC